MSVKLAIHDIRQLEAVLAKALTLADLAHNSCMRASEEIGHQNETSAAHACLGLMELSSRALRQANDAARYARHSMEYPPK